MKTFMEKMKQVTLKKYEVEVRYISRPTDNPFWHLLFLGIQLQGTKSATFHLQKHVQGKVSNGTLMEGIKCVVTKKFDF